MFYGVVLLVMTLMLLIMGRHAEREGLFGDDLVDERKEEARVKFQLLPSLIAYVVAAFLGVCRRASGFSLYLLIAIWLAIPSATCAGCCAAATESMHVVASGRSLGETESSVGRPDGGTDGRASGFWRDRRGRDHG